MARKGGNPGTYFRSDSCSEKMAKYPIAVKLPIALDAWVRSLPNKTEWIREAIAEKKQREQAQQKSSQLEAEN